MNCESGEITYGGLQKIRSNRSPSTASNRLPIRHSTLVMPLIAALNDAEVERARIGVGGDHVVGVA